jgi:ankyrin repeat protein
LFQAAQNGHGRCVEIVLPQSKEQSENMRALIAAAKNGHAQCVEQLIPYSGFFKKDNCALPLAAGNGHTDVVRMLMKVCSKQTVDDALMAAVSNGNHECAKELIVKASRNTKNEALIKAAHCGYASCVELLIPVSNTKAKDSQALRFAVLGQHTQCIDILLDVSDSSKVLAELQRVFYHKPEVWELFAQQMESRNQRAILTKAIALRRDCVKNTDMKTPAKKV